MQAAVWSVTSDPHQSFGGVKYSEGKQLWIMERMAYLLAVQYYGGRSFGGCGEYGYNEAGCAGECQLAIWSGVSDTMVCGYAKTVMYYVGMMGTAAEDTGVQTKG